MIRKEDRRTKVKKGGDPKEDRMRKVIKIQENNNRKQAKNDNEKLEIR